jgi:UV DNA damage endonuclease
MMRIDYPCLNTSILVPNRTCRLRHATPARLLGLTRDNLARLQRILQWHAEGIHVFRISSEILPFGSHPVNQLPWWELLRPEPQVIGRLIRASGARVSMHPGQFTALNSPRPGLIRRSLAGLAYHVRVLDALGVDASAKILHHLGGTYGDKPTSLKEFIEGAAAAGTCAHAPCARK